MFIHTRVNGSPVEIQTPTHWNLTGRGTTAQPRAVAQQYSSTTFFLLRFDSRNEKFSFSFKSVIILIYLHVSNLCQSVVV
jgi:hypothetical protein